MGGHEPRSAGLKVLHRVHDIEVRRGLGGNLKDLLVAGQFGQGALKPLRVTRQFNARSVCQVFALTRDGELHHARRDRRKDREDDCEEEDDDLEAAAPLLVVAAAAARDQVGLSPDPLPEEGLFTRSDHYRFVQRGIPSVFLMTGFAGEGGKSFRDFLATHYHRVSDDLNQPFN